MITLRDYTPADAERLVLLANNKNVSRFLVYTFPYPYTLTDAQWWIEIGSKHQGAVTKVIEHDGLFIGSVGITPQRGWKAHTAEIGYWLGEAYWGKGWATLALQQMTEYAQRKVNMKKLFAPVFAQNIASLRVLEKCGFEREGLFKHEAYKDGEYHDLVQYAKYNF